MGIYIHIPFCRSKCFYCGFYSVASLRLKDIYLYALEREIEQRKDYLPNKKINSLYFGGGTPSLLDVSELEKIVRKLRKNWEWDSQAECSIEMNPEDATPEKLMALKRMGFNRLTIGVQSFNDRVLKQINRSHSSSVAIDAVANAHKIGFDSIGLDLMIGLPGTNLAQMKSDVEMINQLNIDHISVYILSIDLDSVFEKKMQKKQFVPQNDDVLAEQYLMVCECLKSSGYEHYEISNFAKHGKYSRHNTSYWQQVPYIGLGAAAHSFDGQSRQWNVSNIKRYTDSLNNNLLDFQKEELERKDVYNEYLMTRFRTMWGIDVAYLRSEFPEYWEKTRRQIEQLMERELIVAEEGRFRMTEKGWLLSDGLFSELFV